MSGTGYTGMTGVCTDCETARFGAETPRSSPSTYPLGNFIGQNRSPHCDEQHNAHFGEQRKFQFLNISSGHDDERLVHDVEGEDTSAEILHQRGGAVDVAGGIAHNGGDEGPLIHGVDHAHGHTYGLAGRDVAGHPGIAAPDESAEDGGGGRQMAISNECPGHLGRSDQHKAKDIGAKLTACT